MYIFHFWCSDASDDVVDDEEVRIEDDSEDGDDANPFDDSQVICNFMLIP